MALRKGKKNSENIFRSKYNLEKTFVKLFVT